VVNIATRPLAGSACSFEFFHYPLASNCRVPSNPKLDGGVLTRLLMSPAN
jgi:hypothetical protein